MDQWNQREVPKPPSVTVEYSPQDLQVKKFGTRLNTAMDAITKTDQTLNAVELRKSWRMEAAILNSYVKTGKRHKSGKHYNTMKKVARAVARWDELGIPSYVSLLQEMLPESNRMNSSFRLPSRQMIEYLLIRIVGGFHLLLAVDGYCRQAASHQLMQITTGHFFSRTAVHLGTVARISALSIDLANQISSLHDAMRPCLPHLKGNDAPVLVKGGNWPSNLQERLRDHCESLLRQEKSETKDNVDMSLLTKVFKEEESDRQEDITDRQEDMTYKQENKERKTKKLKKKKETNQKEKIGNKEAVDVMAFIRREKERCEKGEKENESKGDKESDNKIYTKKEDLEDKEIEDMGDKDVDDIGMDTGEDLGIACAREDGGETKKKKKKNKRKAEDDGNNKKPKTTKFEDKEGLKNLLYQINLEMKNLNTIGSLKKFAEREANLRSQKNKIESNPANITEHSNMTKNNQLSRNLNDTDFEEFRHFVCQKAKRLDKLVGEKRQATLQAVRSKVKFWLLFPASRGQKPDNWGEIVNSLK